MDHLALLEREVDAFATALARADLDAPVAACPGWTVRELAGHVAGIHRWVLLALADEGPPPYDGTPAADPVADYRQVATEMVARLGEAVPDAPAWTFDKGNRTAAFWRRRQLHEVAVHRWDVAAYDLTDQVAVDAVDEVMTFFAPRQVALGRATFPEQQLVVRTAGREWLLGDGPQVVVDGAPSDVALQLWGRGAPRPAGWEQLTP